MGGFCHGGNVPEGHDDDDYNHHGTYIIESKIYKDTKLFETQQAKCVRLGVSFHFVDSEQL